MSNRQLLTLFVVALMVFAVAGGLFMKENNLKFTFPNPMESTPESTTTDHIDH